MHGFPPPVKCRYIGDDPDMQGPLYYLVSKQAGDVILWSDDRHNPASHGNTWRGTPEDATKLFELVK